MGSFWWDCGRADAFLPWVYWPSEIPFLQVFEFGSKSRPLCESGPGL